MNPRTTWSPALSYASGTASSYLSMPQRGPHQWLAARTGHYLSHEQFAG